MRIITTLLYDSPTLSLRPSRNATERRAEHIPGQPWHRTATGCQVVWAETGAERGIADRHPAFHGQRLEQVEDGSGYGGGPVAVNQGDILLRQRGATCRWT